MLSESLAKKSTPRVFNAVAILEAVGLTATDDALRRFWPGIFGAQP